MEWVIFQHHFLIYLDHYNFSNLPYGFIFYINKNKYIINLIKTK